MATFRIALVLVCLMAVGATKTCEDGADSETCSQLDTASLIQLPATATVSQVEANVAAAHLGASGGLARDEHCGPCMEKLKKCLATFGTGQATGAQVGLDGSMGDHVVDTSCDDFLAVLNGPEGESYRIVLCVAGHADPPNLMAKAMPNFDSLCGDGSGISAHEAAMAAAPMTLLEGGMTRVCIDPSDSGVPVEAWACPCLDDMKAACEMKSNKQACYHAFACAHGSIATAWKDNNCDGVAERTDGCPHDVLVETNTSMEARAKEARVEEDTPSQALDDSLSGKRTC